MKTTQKTMIVAYMKEFGSITQLEAIRDIGCYRLASRISELRNMGVPIESERVAVDNRYGKKSYIKRYRLGGENNG
jgi:hypothetical protein